MGDRKANKISTKSILLKTTKQTNLLRSLNAIIDFRDKFKSSGLDLIAERCNAAGINLCKSISVAMHDGVFRKDTDNSFESLLLFAATATQSRLDLNANNKISGTIDEYDLDNIRFILQPPCNPNPSLRDSLAEMGIRDLVRGLRLGGDWELAFDVCEYVKNKQFENRKKHGKIQDTDRPAFIRYMGGDYSDLICFGLYVNGEDPEFITVDVTQGDAHLSLMETGQLFSESRRHHDVNENNRKEYYRRVWRFTFGSYVCFIESNKGDKCDAAFRENIVLRDYLLQRSIKILDVSPAGIMHSLPFFSGIDENGTYAFEHFDISLTTFSRFSRGLERDKNASSSGRVYIQSLGNTTVNSAAGICKDYMDSEVKILTRIFEEEGTPHLNRGHCCTSSVDDTWDTDASYSNVFIATHNDTVFCPMNGAGLYFPFGNEEIEVLDVRSLSSLFSKGIGDVFLNGCAISTHNPLTDLSEEPVPATLIDVGVNSLVATVEPVESYEALRVSVTFARYIVKGHSPRQAFRRTLMDCKNGNASFFVDELEAIGADCGEISRASVDAQIGDEFYDWRKYVFWS